MTDLVQHIEAKLRVPLLGKQRVRQHRNPAGNRIIDVDRRPHPRGGEGALEIIAVIDAREQLVRERAGIERETHIVIGGEDLRVRLGLIGETRSEEHTSELQSLMRISYAVFCLKKKQLKNY